jgi:hypothetical protein
MRAKGRSRRAAVATLLLAGCLAAPLASSGTDAGGPASSAAAPAATLPPVGLAPTPTGAADNTRCFVCHANYDFNEEPLALRHAQANVGCVQCHGPSPRHSADEDGLTPPDRMFSKGHIRFNCLGCHDWVRLVTRDKTRVPRPDLPELPNHQAVLDGTAARKLCTDCHGDHRLGHRTRVWDKRSGKLLRRDATPAMLRPTGSAK